MKRWLIVGAVAMVVMMVGAWFAYGIYKDTRPSPIWVPLQVNQDMTTEKQDEIAKELRGKLLERDYLVGVSKELNLKNVWKMESDEKSADELAKRLFVRVGTYDTPMGRVPSINIGVNGIKKETENSTKIAMHLAKRVWAHLGLEPPREQ